MKIKAINLFEYEEPFQSPMITPKIKLNERKSLIIEILTHDDQSYYGECNAFATNWYDNETIERVIETINTWKSQIIGKVFTSFDAWLPYLSELDSMPATRATVVMAVYQMYHTLPSFSVEYGATVSGLSNSQLLTLYRTKPKRIKLKWFSQLAEDLKRIRQLDFECDIAIDANESLTVDSFSEITELESEDILYIEEPFKSLDTLNELNASHYPSIAIDEKATSIKHIVSIVNQYPVKVVVLKPFRLGGIDKVIEAMKILKAKGIQFVVGGMYEFGLSRYFTAMLAKEGDYPGDITPSGYYFKEDLAKDSGILKEGMIEFTPPKVELSKLKPL